jgi:RNA polymerase sigma factor for flagellar operon FliA
MLDASRADLMFTYLDLIETIRARISREIGTPAAADSLDAAGLDGLIVAATSFDPTRGVPFAAWARLKIRGAMLNRLARIAEGSFTGEEAGGDSPEATAIAKQRQARLRTALDGLDPSERAVIALRYFAELGRHEAAARLGITTSQLDRTRLRAIRRLRRAVDD